MFEDDEDEEDQLSEIESWYEDNIEFFVRNSKPDLGVTTEIEIFYKSIYTPYIQELAPVVRKLIYRQYPTLRNEIRPLIVDYIDDIIQNTGHLLIMNMQVLIQDQNENLNLRELYPEFEEMIKTYARPEEPPLPNHKMFDNNPQLKEQIPEDIRQQIIDESYKEEMEFYSKTEKLKKEFYDVVQPVLLKNYPALLNLDGDGWIVYAFHFREEYESYLENCDYVDAFIEYNFEEKDIHMDYNEFMKQLGKKMEDRLNANLSSTKK